MTFKIILAIFFVIIGATIGMLLSNSLKNRLLMLQQYQVMLKRIKLYLSYENMKTFQIIKKLSESQYFSKLTFLKNVYENMQIEKNFPQIWKEQIDNSQINLFDGDKLLILSLGDILGSYELNSQIESIELQEKLLEEKITEAREKFLQLGKLYRSLGILLGIACGILIL
ncbi:MAG: stage III sporulation protein AB [Oscillospiraceae bacterium]